MSVTSGRLSERRAEHLLNDLLKSQGWDLRRPPQGDVLYQQEYRSIPELHEILSRASKSGSGVGVPEALLVERATSVPLAVIEAKRSPRDVATALREAQCYADACIAAGHRSVAVGLAGTRDDFELRVAKWAGTRWVEITYDGSPINWIPNKVDLARICQPGSPAEIRPTVPPQEVLAERAEEINRLLRESNVTDAFRPAVVAAVMLALWKSRGNLRRDPRYILHDVNSACRDVFLDAGKTDLAQSLRVDEANGKLAERARRMAAILERLNVTVLTAEHDYLGQLYETFFRYTGGNTIGQYFTPRHVTRLMVELCGVTREDVVLDPACGTGGFLIAAMERILRQHHLTRAEVVEVIKSRLVGFESEPVTAALCVANMILRGDGSTGVVHADCLTSERFPKRMATVALMNPPFPHKQTDTPAEAFVKQALAGLRRRGKLAVILPTSLLVKRDKGPWRSHILKGHTLLAVCQLPDELFQPFASTTTSIVLLEQGMPHDPRHKTVFVRLHHDGLTLRKGVRVERADEPNQLTAVLEAVANKTATPGFAGVASVAGEDEWAVGAYIDSAPASDEEIRHAVDVLLRRLASFYSRYAAEVVGQRRAIENGDLVVSPYRKIVSAARLKNAASMSSRNGTIGGLFDIFYGMKELHSREGFAPGPALVVSPTEEYNGCYGWLEYSQLIAPPFVTVAQTGSIGEAFVQLEPCAVNDDCLVLVPREAVSEAQLVLAAACLHAETWRFTYGRKLTPSRISDFKLPTSPVLEPWIAKKLAVTRAVIRANLAPYVGGESQARLLLAFSDDPPTC